MINNYKISDNTLYCGMLNNNTDNTTKQSDSIACKENADEKDLSLHGFIEDIQTNLQNDLKFLNKNNSILIQEVSELSKSKYIYKKLFKSDEKYIEFNSRLNELRDHKLPFRMVDKENRQAKKCGFGSHGKREEYHGKLPAYLTDRSTNIQSRKALMRDFESTLVAQSCGLEDNLALAEQLLWFHGTNSSILPLLSKTKYQMLPAGRLLDN